MENQLITRNYGHTLNSVHCTDHNARKNFIIDNIIYDVSCREKKLVYYMEAII